MLYYATCITHLLYTIYMINNHCQRVLKLTFTLKYDLFHFHFISVTNHPLLSFTFYTQGAGDGIYTVILIITKQYYLHESQK